MYEMFGVESYRRDDIVNLFVRKLECTIKLKILMQIIPKYIEKLYSVLCVRGKGYRRALTYATRP